MASEKTKRALDTSKSPEQRIKAAAKAKADKMAKKIYRKTLMVEACKKAKAQAVKDAKRLK